MSATGNKCGEARDAVENPTMHRTAPAQQKVFQPKISVVRRLRNKASKSRKKQRRVGLNSNFLLGKRWGKGKGSI